MTIAYDDETLRGAYALPDRSTPRTRFNFVASLDGAVTLRGTSGGLGNSTDQRVMGVLRSLCDVVLVGAGTVRAEGYSGALIGEADVRWRLEHGRAAHPPVAVVSGSLDLAPDAPFFTNAPVRPIVLTSAAAPRERRSSIARIADVVDCGDDVAEPERIVEEFSKRGLGQVLCEGGPGLFGSFIAADHVDELCLSIGPHIVGGGAPRISRGTAEFDRPMRLLHALPAGDLVLLRYERARERSRASH